MKRKVIVSSIIAILLLIAAAEGQARHEINFPNIPGYLTLKCDLHMHTVFSDGNVWPTVRVDEAWREGLDAISITDHIEYQPNKGDIPTKHNRPFEIAAESARTKDVLLIKGAEITRDTPPGHFNAIFLKDINPLDTKDFLEVIKRANEQGAFVFWNHQDWKGEEKGRWLEVHTTMYKNKWLHGMEVYNGNDYIPTAHKWCMEKNLTMVGNTDYHEPHLRTKSTPEDHRTMTLVFVKERTVEGIKEALREGRTAVWSRNKIVSREEFLKPLFYACVTTTPAHLKYKDKIWTKMCNNCDLHITLQKTGGGGPETISVPANSTYLFKIKVDAQAEQCKLSYQATNFLIGPGKTLPVQFTIR